MLCMETYGLIMSIVHAAFSEGPDRLRGRKNGLFIHRPVRLCRAVALTQETPGATPSNSKTNKN